MILYLTLSVCKRKEKMNTIHKPKHWHTLPLFQKVQIYRDNLTPAYAPYVDKLQAKEMARTAIPDENRLKIARVVRVLSSPYDLKDEDLIVGEVVVKATHGCGWNIFVGQSDTRQNCIARLRRWNGVYNFGRERQYTYVQPRFFIEEKLQNPFKNIKIRCVGGKAIEFITVTDGNKGNDKKNFYDFHWNHLRPPELEEDITRPARLDDLIEMAEILAAPFEFVRIDFYYDEASHDVWFSEYTFTPSNGAQILDLKDEMRLGRLWQ